MKQFTNRKVSHVRFTLGIQLIGEVKSSISSGTTNGGSAEMELWPMGIYCLVRKGNVEVEKLIPFSHIQYCDLMPEEAPAKEAKK